MLFSLCPRQSSPPQAQIKFNRFSGDMRLGKILLAERACDEGVREAERIVTPVPSKQKPAKRLCFDVFYSLPMLRAMA